VKRHRRRPAHVWGAGGYRERFYLLANISNFFSGYSRPKIDNNHTTVAQAGKYGNNTIERVKRRFRPQPMRIKG
jgi:hypothetical protein